ncbi:hypothetical protein [Bremerella sp.]|uniref:hypothetical protein n=1 Tax=Bremerella sp. TaxID=2795602 RepID=UPI0039193A9A
MSSAAVYSGYFCPAGIIIVVRDFDEEGLENEAVVKHEDEQFIKSVWSANQGKPEEHHS